MKTTHLAYIGFESMKFALKNYKQFFKLALLPSIILALAGILFDFSIEDFLDISSFNEVYSFILSLFFVPFLVVWVKFILNKKKSFRYKDSLVWNSVCIGYVVQKLKFTLLYILYSKLFVLVLGLLAGYFDNWYFIILPMLVFAWLLTVLMRASLIVPAYVDGKKLSIKSAISKTKNLTIPLLVSFCTFVISIVVFMLIIILLITIPVVALQMVMPENAMQFIGLAVGGLFFVVLTVFSMALIEGYSTFLYKKLIK